MQPKKLGLALVTECLDGPPSLKKRLKINTHFIER